MTETPVGDRAVRTRRISFDDALAAVPKQFASDGDLVLSHLAAVLSSVFPDGEDFFVRSVRRFRDEIDDPVLQRQVAGFIGQEAMHGREHRAFNRRLAELGYPTLAFERLTRRGLAIRERVASPRSNLAATAALEHFTATLAEQLLDDEETRRLFGDGEVQNLFLWHALEESEHKAVAFDVYAAVGGSERMRRLTMDLVTVGFLAGITLGVAASLARDPAARRPRVLLASLRRLRRSPLLRRDLWRRLREYNRPGFHPHDRDATALVERWRDELFGADGTLAGRLAGAAA